MEKKKKGRRKGKREERRERHEKQNSSIGAKNSCGTLALPARGNHVDRNEMRELKSKTLKTEPGNVLEKGLTMLLLLDTLSRC